MQAQETEVLCMISDGGGADLNLVDRHAGVIVISRNRTLGINSPTLRWHLVISRGETLTVYGRDLRAGVTFCF
jgi:hypothetical protein